MLGNWLLRLVTTQVSACIRGYYSSADFYEASPSIRTCVISLHSFDKMKAEVLLLSAVLVVSTGWCSRRSSKFPVGDWSQQDSIWSSEDVERNSSTVREKFVANNYQTTESSFTNSYERNLVKYRDITAHKPILRNDTSKVDQEFIFYHDKPKPQQMHQKADRKYILKKVQDIARALLSLGLINPCSHEQNENSKAVLEEIIELILLNMRESENKSISRIRDHVQRLLLYSVRDNNPSYYCQRINDALATTTKHLKSIVSHMDDELVFFLSNELELIDLTSKRVADNFSIFSHFADHVCKSWVSREAVTRHSCVQILESLRRVLSPFSNDFEKVKSNSTREIRSLGIFPKNSSIYERRNGYGDYGYGYRRNNGGYQSGGYGYNDGGHGLGGGGYGYGEEYEDDSNLIIIPSNDNTDDYDKKLIKLIGALAIGTYGILGTLVLKTLLSSLLTHGRPGPSGDKGFKGIKGMKGMKGMSGDKGMLGEKGPKGPKGIKGNTGADGGQGDDGDAGPPGEAGADGGPGDPGMMGDEGDPAETGEPGEPGEPGTAAPLASGALRWHRNRKKRNYIVESFQDSPALLNSLYTLYRRKDNRSSSSETHVDVISRLNNLWRAYRDPAACGKCSLFNFLQDETVDNLDSFIVAGFAHVLGDTGSLQLLDQVRRTRHSGSKMRCRRSNNSCELETFELPDPSSGGRHLWRETY
ncbi:Collagen triple helix repeat [Trinorchestia longiramus]|nr:Collagen triple helix repeat [Trinorchestia longiramus]